MVKGRSRKRERVLRRRRLLASPSGEGTAAKKPHPLQKGVLAQMLPFIGPKTPPPAKAAERVRE
jgi:hypothetical protein